MPGSLENSSMARWRGCGRRDTPQGYRGGTRGDMGTGELLRASLLKKISHRLLYFCTENIDIGLQIPQGTNSRRFYLAASAVCAYPDAAHLPFPAMLPHIRNRMQPKLMCVFAEFHSDMFRGQHVMMLRHDAKDHSDHVLAHVISNGQGALEHTRYSCAFFLTLLQKITHQCVAHTLLMQFAHKIIKSLLYAIVKYRVPLAISAPLRAFLLMTACQTSFSRVRAPARP